MKIKFLQGEKITPKGQRYQMQFTDANIIFDTEDYVSKLWFVRVKGFDIMFWDDSYDYEFWPLHGTHSHHIDSVRGFRRYLKKAAKYLPNGTILRLYSRFWKPETKEVFALEGEIKNKLTEDDSRQLIRAEMDVWLNKKKEK